MNTVCIAEPTRFTMPVAAGCTATGMPRQYDVAFDHSRFQVVREIAQGGMGRILEATDRLLGRRVAIKISLTRDPTAYQRLGREAAILSMLEDPSIPPVFEFGRLPGGAPYFATRLIDGETLRTRLRAAPERWPDVLAIIADVADAMARAHRSGVIHRDLKPSNILVDAGGRSWVIDWGIARVFGDRAREPSLAARAPEALLNVTVTTPGEAVGTPGYWSPEQQTGEVGDPRSDIYSLGAILYHMTRASAPGWLIPVIAKATAMAPSDRYQSAGELAAELRLGLAGISPAVPGPG
jgi:eukaryotic-like serine/threonine-protein kinase